MFKKPKKSSGYEDIQGVRCHKPPMPSKDEMMNFGLASTAQKWKRTELPTFSAQDIEIFSGTVYAPDEPMTWDEVRREEIIAQTGKDPWSLDNKGQPKKVIGAQIDEFYINEFLEEFRAQEYERIENGFWFLNRGKPVYLTGFNYFYLNWWELNTGYPDYRDTDRQLFCFWQYCLEDDNCYGLLEITKRGNGKCLGINELVRTYSGSVLRAGDVKRGDLLMGDDSTPRLVVDAYQGVSELYDVIPYKGDKHTVNENHTLHCIINRPKGSRGAKKTTYEHQNISVKDYLKLSYSAKKRLKIRREGWGAHWEENDHKVSAYFLGLWLGDGRARSTEITNIDKEVIEYLGEYAEEKGVNLTSYDNLHWSLSQRQRTKIKGWHAGTYMEFDSREDFNEYFGHNKKAPIFSANGTGVKEFREGDWKIDKIRNRLLDEMNQINVINNKHIPDDYLKDSLKNRLELLAGLIDSDGCLVRQKNGNPNFFKFSQSVKREELARQVIELARSCGFMVNYKVNHVTLNGKKTFHFNICIYGDIEIIPTKIKRKQAEAWKKKYNPMYCGFTVKFAGEGAYAGFETDRNHLFLLADGTVTHNSYRMGSVAYLQTVRYSKAHVGIQSKTGDDAEEMFTSKVVEPYKQLPEFLIPIHNHGTEPQTKLSFFPPAERGVAAIFAQKKKDALRSMCTFRNAGERAYDGTTLKFLIQDEIGKLEKKNGDAQKRLGVNRNCVYRDSRMVGKIWASTTVEDMDKGGEQVKKIWYASDITDKSAIGRTESGLYRFFTSALEASYFDAWGQPMIAKAKKEHDAERAQKEGDSVEYIGYIQRNPYTIEEAFMTLGGDCIYNAAILQGRQAFLQEFEMTTKGDFVWKDGIRDSKVIFVPNKINGAWEVSWLFDKEEQTNMVAKGIEANGFKTHTPKNDPKFAAALDPVSHKQTVEKRRSKAGITIYRKYDPWDIDQSDTFVADYVYRHDDPNDDNEAAICACVYFGISILIENNKSNALDYFYQRGYADFIMTRPANTTTRAAQITDGIPSNTPVIEHYIQKMRTHVAQHGYKLNHLRIVRDLLDFNPAKPTKFDLGVASQLTLVAASKFDVMDQYNSNEYNIEELFA